MNRRRFMIGCLGILFAALIVVLWILYSPRAYIGFMKLTGMGAGAENSYEAKGIPGDRTEFENGVTLISDICYDTAYPNSYLDIYRQGEGEQPLFLYIHGGGYAWGDKAEGDPNAGALGPEGATRYLQEIALAGYTVASMDMTALWMMRTRKRIC